MPYKKAKKSYRPRYRRKGRRKMTMQLTPPIPLQKMVKLRYCECFNLDPVGAGAVATYVYRANSIFDPNYTGIGHQPLGHDEWETFYKKYRVLGSRLTVQAASNSALATGQCIVSVNTSFDPISALVYNTTTMERTGSVWTILGAVGSSNGSKRLIKNWSAKKSFGKDWNDDDTGATFGANPVKPWYFLINAQSPDTGGDATVISCTITIDYICEFSEPVELPQS